MSDIDTLRASLDALADEWDAASAREQPLADRYAGYHQGVVTARRKAADELRSLLGGPKVDCEGSESTCYTHGAPWAAIVEPEHCEAVA